MKVIIRLLAYLLLILPLVSYGAPAGYFDFLDGNVKRSMVSYRSMPTEERVARIHYLVNSRVHYVRDEYNLNVASYKGRRQEDVYLTPKQTLLTGSGDCEDSVIAKYYLALHAGVPESELTLAFGYTTTESGARVSHVVLLQRKPGWVDSLVFDLYGIDVMSLRERTDFTVRYRYSHGDWTTETGSGSVPDRYSELLRGVMHKVQQGQ